MNLINELPSFYNCNEIVDIQEAFDNEKDILNKTIEDFINNLYVLTTSNTDNFDKFFQVNVSSSDIEVKRNNIISKIRGHETATKKLIKEIVEGYEHGEVDIIEDNKNYTFTIKFTTRKGIPENDKQIKLSIEQLKPAHLKAIYEYLWNTWNEVNIYSWDEASKFTWDGLAGYEILYGLTNEQLSKMKERELAAYKNNEMIKNKEV